MEKKGSSKSEKADWWREWGAGKERRDGMPFFRA